MAVNLSFIGGAGWQFLTDNGKPLSGGKVYTYAAGTTTPLATYTDRTGVTSNTNPIVLDSAGRTPYQIWSTEGLLYKYVVKSSSDVQLRSWDNIGGSVVASDLAQDLAAPSGASLVGANAYQTQDDVNKELVSVKRFGADPTQTAAFNTTAIATAIAATPVGGILDGYGGVYKSTGITINKSITVRNLTIEITQASGSPTVQKAISITADYVTLKNCGTLYTITNVPTTPNVSGVYSEGTDGLLIDGGIFDGSRNGGYAPGVYHTPIYLVNCIEPTVQNTVTKNAGGEQLWANACTRPRLLNNTAYAGGGSGLICTDTIDAGWVIGNIVSGGTGLGNSGLAVGGANVIVAYNNVLDSQGFGISHGEGNNSVNGFIFGNIISGHAKYTSGSTYAGIISQGANGLVIENNTVLAPFTGHLAFGIQVSNLPRSATIISNKIQASSAQGIYAFDAAGVMDLVIEDNEISNSAVWGILSSSAKTLSIKNNKVRNSNTSAASAAQIYIQNPTGTPTLISVCGNTVTDSGANSQYCVYLASVLSNATQYVQRDNVFLNWTLAPYSTTRSCNYDTRGDVFSIAPRTGITTLTNGAISTVVTTAQVFTHSVIYLELYSATSFTLNPVLRVSFVGNGSFTINHTAGTAANEQIKWTVL